MNLFILNENKSKSVETTFAAIIKRTYGDSIQVLLTRRGYPPYKDQWCLPGGHIDQNETARAAIVREVNEEVGLDFNANFFYYFDEIIPNKSLHAVVLVFDGSVSGQLSAQPDEVLEIKWFSYEEASEEDLAFQHNEILRVYQTESIKSRSKYTRPEP